MLVYQRVVPLDFFEHPPGLLSWYQNTHTHAHMYIYIDIDIYIYMLYIYIYRFLICFYFLYVILPAYIFTCLHSAYMYNVCIYMCIFMYIYIMQIPSGNQTCQWNNGTSPARLACVVRLG